MTTFERARNKYALLVPNYQCLTNISFDSLIKYCDHQTRQSENVEQMYIFTMDLFSFIGISYLTQDNTFCIRDSR